jgi:enediyne polyketide synthase
VLLATGGGKGIGAECALALAREHDLALGLLGRADPSEDEELADNLRRVAAAGIPLVYARADVTDEAAVALAVRAIETELGAVTALLHAAGVNDPTLLSDLDEDAFRATLGPKVDGLSNVLAAVEPARLELVVTFGSILARMGIRGEAHYSWANERLGALVAGVRRRLPGCRCLNVEWSVWAGLGMGEKLGAADALARAGVTAISVEDGVALLAELVRAPGLPSSVVATGRFGRPGTLELERGETPLLRFLERPLVDYPGIKLVAEVELSPTTDPYLAEHALDGVPLLPAVLGLEAMAQVAAALGVEAPYAFEDVALSRPVTVPADGTRRIRIAGLRRRDGAVDVVVRSDETGFQAEHFRAVCRTAAHDPEPRLEEPPEERIALRPDDVYDALLFHGPRFRRVLDYRTLAARRLVADVNVEEGQWFGAYLPQRLLLGDPGARDALVHALQACIPHARVLPVGVRRITGEGLGEGPLVVVAREREASSDTLVWDVEARGADGRVRERWEGLTLRRIGALSPPTPWPAPLLAPYLERRLDEIASAHVHVALARRDGPRRPRASDAAFPAELLRRSDGRPELRNGAASAAYLDGYTLAVSADGRVACDAEAATPHAWAELLGADRLALARALADELGEELDTSAARVWAAVECARKTGLPSEEPLALVHTAGEGWSLLRAGRSPVATYATELTGLEPPVAFAFLVEEAP